MVAQVVPLFGSRERRRDWSAEEAAEFYRIEHALLQAGLLLQTDLGVTDEGDPWFVFCRSDGEVFVHIAWLDGEYQLHSPALRCPLKGRVFAELSKSFINQAPLHIPVRRTDQSTLFVHPAAILAIVIGTILIASDDNFGFSPPGQHRPEDGSVESAPSDRMASGYFKSALQGTFLKLAETFFGGVRAQIDSFESNYLNMIAAIAACVVGVTIGSDTDLAAIASTLAEDSSQDQPIQIHAALVTPSNGDNGFDVSHLTAIETIHGTHNDEQIIEAQPRDSFELGSRLTKIAVAPITDTHAATAIASSHAADQESVIPFEATRAQEDVKFMLTDTGQLRGIVSLSASGQGQSQSAAAIPAVTTKAQPDAAFSSSDQLERKVNPAAVAPSDSQHTAALSDAQHSDPQTAASSTAPAAPAAAEMSLQQIVNNAVAGDHAANSASVEAALLAFWGANPHAQAVYNQQNVIVYDETTPLAAATVQVWELGHGAVIAIVGYADSPTAHV